MLARGGGSAKHLRQARQPKPFGGLMRWVPVFAKAVMRLANRFPRVSGFYRLLRIVMDVCEQQRYFRGMAPAWLQGASSTILRGEEDEDEDEEDEEEDDDEEEDRDKDEDEENNEDEDEDEDMHGGDGGGNRTYGEENERDGEEAKEAKEGKEGVIIDGTCQARQAREREREYFFNTFTHFIGQVVLRLTEYKDELLASCIELVLSVRRMRERGMMWEHCV